MTTDTPILRELTRRRVTSMVKMMLQHQNVACGWLAHWKRARGVMAEVRYEELDRGFAFRSHRIKAEGYHEAFCRAVIEGVLPKGTAYRFLMTICGPMLFIDRLGPEPVQPWHYRVIEIGRAWDGDPVEVTFANGECIRVPIFVAAEWVSYLRSGETVPAEEINRWRRK